MMSVIPGQGSRGSAAALILGHVVALPENHAALLAIQQILQAIHARRPEHAPSPLFLHGPPGCGKSLLAKTLIDNALRAAPQWSVQLLAAGDLRRLETNADGAESGEWEEQARLADLVVIEDLQRLLPAAAEAVTQLFDQLQAGQQLIVFTATVGPGQLLQLPRRLTSRLASGLVVNISPLSAASRFAVLHDRAQRRQLAVSRDVLVWLAKHLRGGRQLEGALNRLDALLRQQHGTLNVAVAAQHFQEDVEAAQPTVERIAQRVGKYFHVPARQLQSTHRTRRVLLPRQLSMYLARQLTTLSLREIGQYFGGRDHTTVLHACRKVEDTISRDAVLSGAVRQFQAELV